MVSVNNSFAPPPVIAEQMLATMVLMNVKFVAHLHHAHLATLVTPLSALLMNALELETTPLANLHKFVTQLLTSVMHKLAVFQVTVEPWLVTPMSELAHLVTHQHHVPKTTLAILHIATLSSVLELEMTLLVRSPKLAMAPLYNARLNLAMPQLSADQTPVTLATVSAQCATKVLTALTITHVWKPLAS